MAATRQREGYPTRARMLVPETDLREIGSFDWDAGEIVIPMEAHAALTRWLGMAETAAVPEHELRRTTVVMVEDATAQAGTT